MLRHHVGISKLVTEILDSLVYTIHHFHLKTENKFKQQSL